MLSLLLNHLHHSTSHLLLLFTISSYFLIFYINSYLNLSFSLSLIESIYLSTSPLLNPSSIPCHMSFCLPFIPHPLISIISCMQTLYFSQSNLLKLIISHNLLPSNTNLYIFIYLFSFFSLL